MKAILMSIRPQHLVNILNGHKTLELRKTVPKDFKGWCHLYCTKNEKGLFYDKENKSYFLFHKPNSLSLNSKVVARFWFDEYNEFKVTEYGIETDGISRLSFINMQEATQLTFEELQKYISVGKIGYAWHIDNLEIFDEPKELSEFYKNNIPYVAEKEIKHAIEINDIEALSSYKITKAPQSWMYVEVDE